MSCINADYDILCTVLFKRRTGTNRSEALSASLLYISDLFGFLEVCYVVYVPLISTLPRRIISHDSVNIFLKTYYFLKNEYLT